MCPQHIVKGGVNHIGSGSASDKCDPVDVPCTSVACPSGLKFATNACGLGSSAGSVGAYGYFHVFQLTTGKLQMSVVDSLGKREYCANLASARTEMTTTAPSLVPSTAPSPIPSLLPSSPTTKPTSPYPTRPSVTPSSAPTYPNNGQGSCPLLSASSGALTFFFISDWGQGNPVTYPGQSLVAQQVRYLLVCSCHCIVPV